MSSDELSSLMRAEARAGRVGEQRYLELCRLDSSAAAAHLDWRIGTGDLTEDRVRLAAHCGHPPAVHLLPPRRERPGDLWTWFRWLRQITGSPSQLIEAAGRLVRLLIQEWVIREDFFARDPVDTAYLDLVLDAHWRAWEFQSPDALRAELEPLLEHGTSLRLPAVEQEILLRALEPSLSSWDDAGLTILLKRIELGHLDDGLLLRRVVWSNTALWSLRLSPVSVWSHRPRDLLRDDYPLLAI